MRPPGVVIGNPSGDDLPSLIEIEEQAFVEKPVAHPAVECFHLAVLHRFAGCDVVPLDSMLFATMQYRVRGELGAVVGHDHPRLATPFDEHRQLAGGPFARYRGVWDRRQAFPCHIIDNIEDAQAPTAGKLVVDKVEGPGGIGFGLDEDGSAASHCLPARSTFAHRRMCPDFFARRAQARTPGARSRGRAWRS
jgi:hypothetical protein